MGILKKCCGLSELLAQPVDKLCTFSKMVANNAQLRPQKITTFASLAQYFTRGLSLFDLYMTYNTIKHHLGKKKVLILTK